MAFLAYHISRIKKLRYVPASQVKRAGLSDELSEGDLVHEGKNMIRQGYVLYIKYRNAKLETKYAMFLVLDPMDAKGYMHVLDLDAVRRNYLEELITYSGAKAPVRFKHNNETFTYIRFEADPEVVYRNKIRDLVYSEARGSYKTLRPDRMLRVQLVDYRWTLDTPQPIDEDEDIVRNDGA